MSDRLRRTGVTILTISGLAAVLAGCAGEGDDIAADRSTTSSTSFRTTSSTTMASTSSSSSPTSPSTTSNGTSTTTLVRPSSSTAAPVPPVAGCPAIERPVGERSETASADVDGDGRPDAAYVVQGDDGWTVVVELAKGSTVGVPIVGVDRRSFVWVLGGADLMGSGSQDLVLVTSVGAYTEQVGFVRLSGCDLFELAFEDSSPARFLTGASISNGEALYCPGDGTLERYFFNAIPGSEDDSGEPRYEGGFEPFRIEGSTVVRLPGDGTSLTPEDVANIRLFDCLGLEL